jgi:hypothetical protein
MPNPRAQQQLAQVSPNPLDRAVHSLKSISQPAQALGDMLASTLRGSTAATLGAGGDIRELVDLLGPEKVEAMLGKRVLPTTEEMKGMLPKATSYEHPYESIGEFLPLPGTGAAMKAASYGAGRGAGALTRAAGQAVSDAMIHQAGPLASGPLSALAPRMAMTNVVKPKGGNWMDSSTNINLDKLKSSGKDPVESLAEMDATYTPEAIENLPPALKDYVKQSFQDLEKKAALNNWIDKTVKGYVKNEMATPEDRVRLMLEKRYAEIEAKFAKDQERAAKMADRAAAESDPRRKANLSRQAQEMAAQATDERDLSMQHIAHIPSERLEANGNWLDDFTAAKRKNAGYPEEGMAQTGPAKGWEIMADQEIKSTPAGQSIYEGSRDLERYPWLAKLDKSTPVYRTEGSFHKDLGFDHVMDVLKEGITEGRITPEQLSKITMDQAVKMAADYDLGKAKAMREAAIKTQEGFPVHKDYGDEGYKWLELAPEPAEKLRAKHEASVRRDFPDLESSDPNKFEEYVKDSMYSSRTIDQQKLADALKYEGDVMGHCVGGYCPDVAEGRSRIYSLRDKKGEPHVTVEVKPNQHLDFNTWFDKQPQELRDEINARARRGEHGGSVFEAPEYLAAREALPPSIKQIKGKQNQAPKEEYLPYVQDFVRSGEWSDVGDLKNTGLIDMNKSSIPWSKDIQPEQIDQLVGGMEGGTQTPRYGVDELRDKALKQINKRYITQQEFDDFLLKELTPPEEGMKAGGVTISDNPDRMWMEVQDQKFGIGGAVKKAAKAAKEAEKSLPAVLPRAAAKTKEDIRPYAQKMAEMMSGEFVRPDPKKSVNPANKSYAQWKMEQDLEHDIRPKEGVNLTPQEIADIEKQLGMLKVGISGDTSISDKILHRAGKYELQNPSEQEGGPLYGLKGNPWASNYQALKNLQTGVNELSAAHGNAPVLGQYMQMGPEGTNFAQHFADANLQAIDLSNMTKSQIDDVNRIIAAGNQKSGAHPDFPGIQDPYGAYFYFGFYPELRKYWNKLMTQPTFTNKYGLPDGRVIQHAITEPELRDLPVTTTGFSQFQLTPGFDPAQLPLAEHGTYTHKLPEVEGALPTRSKYPTPAQIEFPDVTEYAVKEYRPQDITRVFQTATPRQIIDQQHIDEIKMYEELMKEYTGKADGGAVKQLSQTAQEHLAKLKAIRDQIAPVADAWTAKQAEDANKYTPDIQQFKLPMGKAAGGEISADDIILEERPL